MRRALRTLVLVHRYLGIALCLLFAMWFASGIVMLFVPYPELTSAERFKGLAPLNLSKCCVSPAAAYAKSGLTEPLERMRLVMVLGRPVFQLQPWGGAVVSVFADNGEPMSPLDAQQAVSVAQMFGNARAARSLELSDYDQWTVPNGLDAHRPFHRIALNDAAGTELYVSLRSGEVVRDTTAFERGWNYVGSVLHWIYPTVLRKNWALWDRVVWYGSLVGIVATLSGIVLGIARLRFKTPQRSGSHSPFSGWMYWHHILGLSCSLFVLTWIFSGWLSMDHGRLFAKPDPTRVDLERFIGGAFNPEAFGIPTLPIEAAGAKEIEFIQIAGSGFYRIRIDAQRQQVVTAADIGNSEPEFAATLLTRAAQSLFDLNRMSAAERLDRNDAYYYTMDGSAPSPMLRVHFDDALQTWLHVDPVSGQIVEKIDSSRRLYRWLFNGLHRLDFPFLAARPTARQIAIVVLCVLGFVFSVTAAVIAYRRLLRDLFSLHPALRTMAR
jgi:uncharacterized iron-regulated membrane protein